MKRISFAEYAAIKAINWSTLREMGRSPLHYRHRLENPLEDSTTLAMGRALHTALLEPEDFERLYPVFGGKRRQGKEWEAFAEEHEGATILKTDEYAEVMAMRDAVLRHPSAMAHLSGGVAERTFTWTETVNGIELACKARPDYLAGAIADLKSTRDAGPGPFGRTAARFGYHCQLSWYRRGVRAVTSQDKPMVLVAVESSAPYDVAVYRVDEDALWAADETINDLLRQVATCRANDRWPGANEGETNLQLPPWVFGDQESITDDDDIVFGKGE